MRSRRMVASWLVAGALLAGCSSGSTGSGTATVSSAARTAASSASTPSSAVPRSSSPPSGASSSASSPSDVPSSSAGSADQSADYLPSAANPDPSAAIPGIYIGNPDLYSHRYHFAAPIRVAYDRYPPVGGPHDPVLASCDGVVYPVAVRNENMVHALEHGAVWIAYNPDSIAADDLRYLTSLVPTVPYLVMTPYPGLTAPISVQAWAHQLTLTSGRDQRLPQFIAALRQNPYNTPEPGASCTEPGFDIANPPPFDPAPPGPDAIPMDYEPPVTTG